MNFPWENLFRGMIGLAFIFGLAFLLSNNRRSINWKLVGYGFLFQLIIALSIRYIPVVGQGFAFFANGFVKVVNLGKEGAAFVFGPALMNPANEWGFIFAIQALPNIIFFAALSALLYYLGVLQKVVFVFAWLLSRIGVSGPESVSAAANVFLGQTEAPLLAKPYIPDMNKSELLCVMIGGMATTAGAVLATYVGILGGSDVAQQQYFALQLLTASVMAAPATIVISKLLFPDPNKIVSKDVRIAQDKIGNNVLEAISNGTVDGLKLAVNVGAMLIAFIALMAVLNAVFAAIGDIDSLFGMRFNSMNTLINASSGGRYQTLSLQFILGYIFAPVAWLIGVETPDITLFGQLLGEKTILNEFVAYGSLGIMKSSGIIASQKTILMASFALCGFANFASIGIQIGGIGALAPNQRRSLSELGLKALIGGTLVSLVNACIAGALF